MNINVQKSSNNPRGSRFNIALSDKPLKTRARSEIRKIKHPAYALNSKELFNSIIIKLLFLVMQLILKTINFLQKPMLIQTLLERIRIKKVQYGIINFARSERGDVPGWVLVVLMTTGLVTGIWTVAQPRLSSILKNSLDNMNSIR